MTTLEKIAYLKGIIAASNISDSQTKRIYEAMLDVVDSIAQDVAFNAENIDNIDSRLSEVDDDLDLVESLVFGDDEMYEDYVDDEDDDEYDFADDEDADDFEDYEEDDFAEDEDIYRFSSHDETEPAEESEPAEDAFEDDLEEEQGEEMYEIECPACHETIYLQESVILDGSVDCPNCGEPLEFDIEFEEE